MFVEFYGIFGAPRYFWLMQHVSQANTVTASTYHRIRGDIIAGRLEPGRKLRLDALKSRYGASVSTLRESLSRLASEGLVVAEEQRGFAVAPMSASNLRELADLRILLECRAMEMSFEHGDTEWESRVVAAHHKLSRMEQRMQAGEHDVREEWKRVDSEFHQALIGGCGSAELLWAHGGVFDKYLRYQMRSLTFRGEIAEQEHKILRDAALNRDIVTARETLGRHIAQGVAHSLAAAGPEGLPNSRQ